MLRGQLKWIAMIPVSSRLSSTFYCPVCPFTSAKVWKEVASLACLLYFWNLGSSSSDRTWNRHHDTMTAETLNAFPQDGTLHCVRSKVVSYLICTRNRHPHPQAHNYSKKGNHTRTCGKKSAIQPASQPAFSHTLPKETHTKCEHPSISSIISPHR